MVYNEKDKKDLRSLIFLIGFSGKRKLALANIYIGFLEVVYVFVKVFFV